ncbi:MAG: DUF3301 domain-containing protein [Magnetococcus sp. WYHC-3]
MEEWAIAAILLLGWIWYGNMRAREMARRVAHRLCQGQELVLMDDTVGLARMRPARDAQGHLVWRRVYGFRTWNAVHGVGQGLVILNGQALESVFLQESSFGH